MFSNQSATIQGTSINYPITDGNLPFSDYIKACRKLIEDRREDLAEAGNDAEKIIQANCPYELIPENPIKTGDKYRYGALLIHGLFDSPFTFREIGANLQEQGILTRSLLLPGHGTRPSDLLHISYHDWIQAVRYGVESLQKEVDEVYLVGYSTGAALSIYHAMHNSQIDGLVLISPAVKVRTPVDLGAYWHNFLNSFGKNKNWVFRLPENDYAKYKSIAFNSVQQVSKLTEIIREIGVERGLQTPMFMILSREDETISSHHAIDFFTTMRNEESTMLLYTSIEHNYPDSRIETRLSTNEALNVVHLSHPSLTFSRNNQHYGENGDYINASQLRNKDYLYGAYNKIEIGLLNLLYKLKLSKLPRRGISYNPDFEHMANKIARFISR